MQYPDGVMLFSIGWLLVRNQSRCPRCGTDFKKERIAKLGRWAMDPRGTADIWDACPRCAVSFNDPWVSMADPPTQPSAPRTPEQLQEAGEQAKKNYEEVKARCAKEGKIAVLSVGPAWKCISNDPDSLRKNEEAVQKELEEFRERAAQVQQLEAVYHQAESECAKAGKSVFVMNTAPGGRQARFDCVSPDDPAYRAPHLEVVQPPPPETDLDSRLKPSIGRNVKSVVALVGGPQGEPIVNGDIVYVWGCFTHYYLPHSVLVNDHLTSSCDIRLTTDHRSGVMKSFEWKEQRGGCRIYPELLDKDTAHPSP